MLKIVDVDWEKDYQLELEFSDGFRGTADLKKIFQSDAFAKVDNFHAFSLEGTSLSWGEVEVSADKLRKLANRNGGFVKQKVISADNMEAVLKQAAWDSMMLNRPDILQAAIRGFVEQYGVKKVQEKTRLKSRPSIYKALNPSTSPRFETLVELAHGALAVQSDSANGQHSASTK